MRFRLIKKYPDNPLLEGNIDIGLIEKMEMKVEVKRKKLRPDAKELKYAHKGDSGIDLYPVVFTTNDGFDHQNYKLKPGERVIGKTGWALELPENYEFQVRPTSGNSIKTKLTVILGTVDDCYRGEIGVIIENSGDEIIHLMSGKKMAQMVLAFVPKAVFEDVDELSETDRGQDGFGSTGTIID